MGDSDYHGQHDHHSSSRSLLFRVESGYLLVLAAIFVVYHVSAAVRTALPASLGALPIGVPWFGAVGATLISLTGIFKHADDWDVGFELWHYTRPLIGAFLGSIGALMFAVIVEATATSPQHTNGTVYEVVAFLLGYREATFRSLIQRATDLLLSPSANAQSGKAPSAMRGDSSPPTSGEGEGSA
jgi:hypothetical protein